MNPLRDVIVNEIIQPEIAAANKMFIGTIQDYNSATNMAKVSIDAVESYDGVKIPKSIKSIYGEDLGIGTMVILSFVKGDTKYPYVVAVIDASVGDNSTGKTYEQTSESQTPSATTSSISDNKIAIMDTKLG
jgi:hypothetical protein